MAFNQNPNRIDRSVNDIFARRIAKLESQMATLRSSGADMVKGGARIWVQEIEGDATATDFEALHPFQTRDVQIYVVETVTPWAKFDVDVDHTDIDRVMVKFASAPAAAKKFNVIIVG